MIAIIDYGVGNLFSLECSFSFIGEDVVVTGENDVIDKCDRIILPGVGAFADAAKKLKNSGLDETVKKQALSGKPILGICSVSYTHLDVYKRQLLLYRRSSYAGGKKFKGNIG